MELAGFTPWEGGGAEFRSVFRFSFMLWYGLVGAGEPHCLHSHRTDLRFNMAMGMANTLNRPFRLPRSLYAALPWRCFQEAKVLLQDV